MLGIYFLKWQNSLEKSLLSTSKMKTPFLLYLQTFVIGANGNFRHHHSWKIFILLNRFSFQYWNQEEDESPSESIKKLDFMGTDLIEKHDYDGWLEYLKKYENTICGRFPITILL